MNSRVNKEIQIAVVGCGYWGPNLIRNFRYLSDCQVQIVCDVKDDRLSHMRQLYPEVKTTNAFDHILQNSDIDAIAIATPVRLHFEMAKAVLQAGKHVFIEKPMASSVDECKELIKLAETQNLTIMLGHTFIYSPPVRKAKEIIDYGDIGEIQYISSRRLNLGLFQTDINVAWDLAPHDISIILYILNQPPVSVNCQGKAHVNPKIEDVTNMTLNFANGGFATIQSSWLDPNKVREMTFVGSKRMLLYNDLEPMEKIKIYDKRVETPPHYDTFAEFHYSYHYGDMYAPYIKQYEPLRKECQEFLDCIRTGDRPESSGYEGLQVVKILEAASKSLKTSGAKIMINDLNREISSIYDNDVTKKIQNVQTL
jgi:predicted dehydrogenase